jgi:hypothetical protein
LRKSFASHFVLLDSCPTLILVNNGMDNLIAKIYTNSHAWTACVRGLAPNPDHYIQVYTDEVTGSLTSIMGFNNQTTLDQCCAWMDSNNISYYLKELE